MRAFDVVWGTITGRAVIENSYADVTEILVIENDSAMHVDGRFSLGYPRRDGGEEINARIRVIRRPLADLKHAFELDDYDMDGAFSGEFHVFGNYLTPYGFGQMAIVDGIAYGEPFETAAADVRLEGTGVRLDSLRMTKGGGRATGAAYATWTAAGSPSSRLRWRPRRRSPRSRGSSISPPGAAGPSTSRATTCASRSATCSSATRGSAR
jgi:hypothetical protein